MAAFLLAEGAWKGANFASTQLTGKDLVEHATDLLKSLVSEAFKNWFEKKFLGLKKSQTNQVLELVKTLRAFQMHTLAAINPHDLDSSGGLKLQLVDLLRVICEGVETLSAAKDPKGFEQLVSRFVAQLGMSLQMFNVAQLQGNSSKLDKLDETLSSKFDALINAQEEKIPAGARLLCVGNPGSGKSTLLNGIVGTVLFRSGISVDNLGEGITDWVKWVYHLGIMYGDTPGLDDKTHRMRAAQQIAEGLKAGGVYRLVFVVMLDARSRPLAADLATMKMTLDAINDPKLEYGIIVNKVPGKTARQLKDGLMGQLVGALNSHGSCSKTDRVLLYNRSDELEEESNVLHTPPPDLFKFIRGIPWQSFDNVADLKMAEYQEHVKDMENRLAQQARELSKLKQQEKEHSGYLWKKNGTRVGVGRNFAKGWSQRFVTVEGSILRYADLESSNKPKFEKNFKSAEIKQLSGKEYTFRKEHNVGLVISWADGTKALFAFENAAERAEWERAFESGRDSVTEAMLSEKNVGLRSPVASADPPPLQESSSANKEEPDLKTLQEKKDVIMAKSKKTEEDYRLLEDLISKIKERTAAQDAMDKELSGLQGKLQQASKAEDYKRAASVQKEIDSLQQTTVIEYEMKMKLAQEAQENQNDPAVVAAKQAIAEGERKGDDRKEGDASLPSKLLVGTAKAGEYHAVRYLLAQGADVTYSRNAAFEHACEQGHLEVVRALLQAGADVTGALLFLTWRNFRGTPLNIDVLNLLLEQGADVNAADSGGKTALHKACGFHIGYKNCNQKEQRRLHLEAARALVQAGADLEKTDKEDNTPLHLAAYYGRHEVTRLLLQSGADAAKKGGVVRNILSSDYRATALDNARRGYEMFHRPSVMSNYSKDADRASQSDYEDVTQLLKEHRKNNPEKYPKSMLKKVLG
jgi:ankyrin repeat protein